MPIQFRYNRTRVRIISRSYIVCNQIKTSNVIVALRHQEICNQPHEPGTCEAIFPRFHYAKDSNSCQRFDYGGCGGNDNNFANHMECERVCIQKTRKYS